jgi:excisionase family DNA binding protein
MTSSNQRLPSLIKPAEAAQMLAIGKRALWARTKSGEIPHIKIGKSVRYSVEALEAWIRERLVGDQHDS